MGVDKETTDIWKFGRPRPDLTLDEVLATPMPTLSKAERARREHLINKSVARRSLGMREDVEAMAAEPQKRRDH